MITITITVTITYNYYYLSAIASLQLIHYQALTSDADRFTWEIKKKILGMRGSDWTQIVVNDLSLHDKITPQHLLLQWETNLRELCPYILQMEGADTLTKQLYDRGIPMAIATSSNSINVRLE